MYEGKPEGRQKLIAKSRRGRARARLERRCDGGGDVTVEALGIVLSWDILSFIEVQHDCTSAVHAIARRLSDLNGIGYVNVS